jgi:hypothetical protein
MDLLSGNEEGEAYIAAKEEAFHGGNGCFFLHESLALNKL